MNNLTLWKEYAELSIGKSEPGEKGGTPSGPPSSSFLGDADYGNIIPHPPGPEWSRF